MELHPEDPVQWARLHFAEAELGDARRVKRAEGMAAAMLRAPGESLPLSASTAGPLGWLHRLFVHPREVKAAYRFLDNSHVDPEGLQAGHRQRVRGAIRGQLGVLLHRWDTQTALVEVGVLADRSPTSGAFTQGLYIPLTQAGYYTKMQNCSRRPRWG